MSNLSKTTIEPVIVDSIADYAALRACRWTKRMLIKHLENVELQNVRD
jgi:hypothetical protein